jgi:PilZ domain-containing protein
MSEARTGKRFPLELPIKIRQKGVTADRGTTADMSSSGVYIQADTDLPVGAPIEFDITLPANVLGTAADVEVRCTGRIVRKEGETRSRSKKKKNGVACVIDEYKFIRNKGTK